jgi:hypothetical protein
MAVVFKHIPFSLLLLVSATPQKFVRFSVACDLRFS